MGNQHRGDVRLAAEQGVEIFRIDGLAPGEGQASHIGAKCLRQVGKTITEGANADREDALARRNDVRDGAFQSPGPAGGKDQHVVLRLEHPAQTGFQLGEEGPELGAAVVDHGSGHCPLHALGNGGRAGNPQLRGLSHAP